MPSYSKIHMQIIKYRVIASNSLRLPGEAYAILKENGLLKRKRRGCRGGRLTRRVRRDGCGGRGWCFGLCYGRPNGSQCEGRIFDKATGINYNNLSKIEINLSQSNTGVKLGLCNIQSLRNKSLQISQYITDEDLEMLLLTETWLKDADSVLKTEATPPLFTMKDTPRIDRPGGGTALICKTNFKPFLCTSRQPISFEFSECNVRFKDCTCKFFILYRPPYSAKHPVTLSTFLEEFQEFLDEVIHSPNILILAGDFNIHVDDRNDNYAEQFTDILFSYGLQNNVHFPTHKTGHTLD